MTDTERLQALQKRVTDCQAKRIGAEKELSLCSQQYDELVAELKREGIDDVNTLPQRLEELRQTMEAALAKGETEVSAIESQYNSLKV
jgi:predicted  nucleic acid-binding Zn-ribbon protein